MDNLTSSAHTVGRHCHKALLILPSRFKLSKLKYELCHEIYPIILTFTPSAEIWSEIKQYRWMNLFKD